jgi:hypothetical protein
VREQGVSLAGFMLIVKNDNSIAEINLPLDMNNNKMYI